jgi:LPS-assembly lipoprotein
MSWSERRLARTLCPRPRLQFPGAGTSRWNDEPGRRSSGARLLVGLAFAGVLVGCGFHLRGDVTYAFPTLYVNSPPTAPITAELKRTLESASGTHIVGSAKDAAVILDVTNVTDDKQVLSLSAGGRVNEYQLTKRVGFSLHDSDGHDWLPAGEIVVRRAYTFNESEVLAREHEETRMLKEMQTDVVQQIVRRLQAAKKPAA